MFSRNLMRPRDATSYLFLILIMMMLTFQTIHSQLQVGFYTSSCSLFELLLKDEIIKGFTRDPGVAACIVRIYFHDCFVRVCNINTPYYFFRSFIFN